jgi:hypothetical protein
MLAVTFAVLRVCNVSNLARSRVRVSGRILLEQFDMASTRYLRGKLADAQSQIGQLRDQVQALTTDQLTPAATDWVGKTGAVASRARGAMVDQTQGFSGQVNKRPMAAILIAAILGWAFGRFAP